MGVVTPERERAAQPPEPPRQRRERQVPWALVVLGLIVLAIVAGPGWIGGLLPSFPNPFASETVDRSSPAVLESIRDLREYRAATGHFQVIVDLEQDTALPAAILGERTLFVAVGDVDASVDFSALGRGAVTVSEDRRSAVIRLPPPALSEARLDLERSQVYDRRQGVLNEIGLLFEDERNTEREVYLLAERKIGEAAQSGSGLVRRAERNTRAMLESLLRSLGFTRVEIRFQPDPR
jgi:Protein of unknown function (DUF4230)